MDDAAVMPLGRAAVGDGIESPMLLARRRVQSKDMGAGTRSMFSIELMSFSAAYSVVDFPLPVGPVTKTIPFGA